ncbi:MAG: histidinol-phosphate transaminase [Thiothrix sp.]|nr:MAG: histidinol-phosphate transaminase [Thiothrix sp.]
MSVKPNDWIRPEIQNLSAYPVPPAEGLIKLDAMENPYTWPDELVDKWLLRLKTTSVNRYPDPAGTQLCNRLRETMRIPQGQGVLLGNGSDELIQIIAMAVSGAGRVVMAPQPSFVMYQMIAKFVGMQFVSVPLRAKDFSLDMEVMLAAIEEQTPAVIFLAYPNNPTGNHWQRNDIEKIIRFAPGLVVVDEAYAPFAADSFMSDLGRYPNLLVMRTLSKLGLAGLRLGYLCGPRDWLAEFDKLRLPYNINTLTQGSADLALAHAGIFQKQAEAIKLGRKQLLAELQTLPGVEVFPSDANFFLFRVPAGEACPIHQALMHQGVLIKLLSGNDPMLEDCLRVTVGTALENQAFIRALREILSDK